ncbi:hypothetical protein GmHk_09G025517 [Glycine max]|nr:hypothetical protein GmHk_09G025517 [Glycine max]
MRKVGYVQTIPPHSSTSRLCLEDIDDRWMHFSEYLAPVGQIYVVSGQCAPDYIDWFYMISHPFMRMAQPGDPVRHPPVVQDDTYYLVAAATRKEAPTDAPSHVEQPRHAVDACQAIAERLEQLLNLRIVTKGIEAYSVMEECLRITRGVTMKRNVYVRSR